MHRSLPLSTILLLGAAVAAHAQSSASSDATVSASVSLAPLTMATTGGTDFGTVNAGDIVNQTGNSMLSPEAPGAGQSAALFTASGEPNTYIYVACGPPTALENSSDPSQTITFSGYVATASNAADQPSAVLICAGGGSYAAPLNESGSQYFWLGGQLGVGSASPPAAGAYTGSYTLSINY